MNERWTFLTNHGHILILLAQNPSFRLKDLAQRVGITERAVQRIVSELAAEGYLAVERVGRCNHYKVLADRPLRHAVEQPHSVGELIAAVAARTPTPTPPPDWFSELSQATA